MGAMPDPPPRTFHALDLLLGGTLIFIVGAMLYFSLVAPQALSKVGLASGGNYRIHALGYAGLTLVLLLTFVWNPVRGRRFVPLVLSPLVVGMVIAIGFGVEVLQRVMKRDSEWRDVWANTEGAIAALIIWLLLLLLTRAVSRRKPSGAPRARDNAGSEH